MSNQSKIGASLERLWSKRSIVGAVALVVGAVACSSSGSGSKGGASSAQVSQCKSGCDQAKFFDCSTSAGLSQCYDDCESASSSAIEKFNACSENSICDPSCRELIDPKAPSNGGSSSGGGGVAASDCQSACDKLIKSCNFAPASEEDQCLTACEQQGYQYQIDCINQNTCDKIMSACGGSSSGGSDGPIDAGGTDDFDTEVCQSNCETLHSEECLTASELSTCQADCSSKSNAAVKSFNSCTETSSGADCTQGTDCFSVLDGS